MVLQPQQKSRRSEEHTSELQSRENLVCRLLLEKKKKKIDKYQKIIKVNENKTTSYEKSVSVFISISCLYVKGTG